MTPDQVTLVQTSFRQLVPHTELIADVFYDQLFEQNPEFREFFPKDMTTQKLKLMKTLASAVGHLHQIDAVVGSIRELGAKHVAYGVEDEHYDAVGSALLYTLKMAIGEDWSKDLEEAWIETYLLVADTMKEGASGQAA